MRLWARSFTNSHIGTQPGKLRKTARNLKPEKSCNFFYFKVRSTTRTDDMVWIWLDKFHEETKLINYKRNPVSIGGKRERGFTEQNVILIYFRFWSQRPITSKPASNPHWHLWICLIGFLDAIRRLQPDGNFTINFQYWHRHTDTTCVVELANNYLGWRSANLTCLCSFLSFFSYRIQLLTISYMLLDLSRLTLGCLDSSQLLPRSLFRISSMKPILIASWEQPFRKGKEPRGKWRRSWAWPLRTLFQFLPSMGSQSGNHLTIFNHRNTKMHSANIITIVTTDEYFISYFQFWFPRVILDVYTLTVAYFRHVKFKLKLN